MDIDEMRLEQAAENLGVEQYHPTWDADPQEDDGPTPEEWAQMRREDAEAQREWEQTHPEEAEQRRQQAQKWKLEDGYLPF